MTQWYALHVSLYSYLVFAWQIYLQLAVALDDLFEIHKRNAYSNDLELNGPDFNPIAYSVITLTLLAPNFTPKRVVLSWCQVGHATKH